MPAREYTIVSTGLNLNQLLFDLLNVGNCVGNVVDCYLFTLHVFRGVIRIHCRFLLL